MYRLMSIPAIDPILDDEGRPMWSDSEMSDPGPRDSLLGSDEEMGLARRMRDLQAAAINRERRRDARDAGDSKSLFGIHNFPGRPTGWADSQPG